MAIAKVPDDLFKICQTCGEKFHPNTYRQRNCGKTRTKTCPICGKDFTYICTLEGSKKKTCSRKCADQFAEQVRESKSSAVKKLVSTAANCLHLKQSLIDTAQVLTTRSVKFAEKNLSLTYYTTKE